VNPTVEKEPAVADWTTVLETPRNFYSEVVDLFELELHLGET